MSRVGNGASVISSISAPILSGSGGPWTVALWFKASSLTQTNKYLCQGRSASPQWGILYEYVDDTVEFFNIGGSGSDPRVDSGMTVADLGWHHYVYRKAASGASAWSKALDGSVTTINASITFTLASTTAFTLLGALNASFAPVNQVAGLVAWPGVWSVALSDAEIAALAAGAPPYTIQTANIVDLWDLTRNVDPETPWVGSHNLTVSGATYSTDNPPVAMPGYVYRANQ